MKAFTALTVVLLSLSIAACGGTSKTADSTSRAASGETAGNGNSADSSGEHESPSETRAEDEIEGTDGDDGPVLFYGSPAGPVDQRTITALVTHYYAIAAAENGVQGCKLLYSVVAESVPEDYGEVPALRGKTCAVVMSKLFKRHHRQIAAESATLKVIGVRVEGGDKALAVLRIATIPEPRKIPVHREGRTWKIWELLDSQLP